MWVFLGFVWVCTHPNLLGISKYSYEKIEYNEKKKTVCFCYLGHIQVQHLKFVIKLYPIYYTYANLDKLVGFNSLGSRDLKAFGLPPKNNSLMD